MNNILKNVCSAQKLHGAEHAGSMEHREMEERNSRYRCLKMKAAAAWALAVLLSLLSVFGGEVPYVNEIQMSLAALVLLFLTKCMQMRLEEVYDKSRNYRSDRICRK